MKKQNEKNEDLTDKAFSRLLTSSILRILVCTVCLCSTTYAWFSYGLAGQGNNGFVLTDTSPLSLTVSHGGKELENVGNGVELEAGEIYTVTLSLPPNTDSGYCLITASGNTYYTDYIVRHNDAIAQTVSFELSVETTQNVTFTSRWGIYADNSDVADGKLMIP